jgi:hypothetical protein
MTDTAAPPPPAPEPVRRSSAGRLIRRLLLAVVVLIILAVVILFLSLNSLVRAGIVRGGHDATGQNTDLTSANLSLVGGTLQLAELGIHNPEGYTAPPLLTMKSCDVTVQSSSIFSHTVVIDSIAIDGLNINLEQNGMKNNLSEIIDTIQKKTSAADTTGTSNAPPGKELKITRLSLTGTKVHIRSGAPLNLNMDLDLPPLSIDDPTNPDGRPMKIADLVGKILLQLSKQIVENPALPPGIRDSMKNVQVLVDNLKGNLDKGVKQFSASIQDAAKNMDPSKLQEAGKDLQNTMKDAGKNVKDATKGLQDAGKNLGGMFNNNKQPAQNK